MRRPSHRAFVVLLAMLVITVESAAQVVDFSPAMVFRRPSISDVSVSPSGDWVAARIRHAGAQGIVVQRRGEAIKHAILSSRLREIRSVVWVGPDSLFVPYVFRVRGDRRATVYRLRADEGGAISAEEVDIDRGGRLVSGLPARDGVVLWSTRSGSRSVVYRATIEALAVEHKGLDSIRKEGTHPVEIVAQTRDAVWAWVTDRKGTVRSYVSRSFEAGEVTYAIAWRAGDADEWREVWRSDGDEDPLIPLGVTRDGRGLIVAAYAGRDTRGLHVFDPDAKRLGEVLFVHPEVDVVDAVFDHDTDQIIAVGYRVAGAMRYRYLASYTHEHLSELATRVGEEGLRITSASLDHRHFTMLTTGPDDPGTFYFYSQPKDEWTKLADRVRGVQRERLVTPRIIRTVSADDLEVEGFLFLPEVPPTASRAGSVPMLALPHGGPIGVADGDFNPFAQYVALNGIAVLQVNYRGSAGYGKAFLEAGLGEYGRGIEADIDAMVEAVIEMGVVDPERMCIGGGSYGGFSALVSAIDRPDRYRCVFTINGVTDLPLSFQGSDWSLYEAARAAKIEIVGYDPEKNFEAMRALSPVYRADEIRVPVLIGHGTRDARVDAEHAHRLRWMLEVDGKPYEWVEMEGGGHAPTQTEWIRYASAVRAFLFEHLGRPHPHDPS